MKCGRVSCDCKILHIIWYRGIKDKIIKASNTKKAIIENNNSDRRKYIKHLKKRKKKW